jgi:hypothetical protein
VTSVEQYPELSDSANNIHFMRQSEMGRRWQKGPRPGLLAKDSYSSVAVFLTVLYLTKNKQKNTKKQKQKNKNFFLTSAENRTERYLLHC